MLEVLANSTRRLDLREKKDAYLASASLDIYLLIEQMLPTVILYRRTDESLGR